MSVYAPKPVPGKPKCPKCGMTAHEPDVFCDAQPKGGGTA